MDQTQQPLAQPALHPTTNTEMVEIKKAHSLSTWGLILSVVVPPVGTILSVVAYMKLEAKHQNSGLALAGIIVGAIMTALGIIAGVIYLVVFKTWLEILDAW